MGTLSGRKGKKELKNGGNKGLIITPREEKTRKEERRGEGRKTSPFHSNPFFS
jgi:hypothetical protein